MSEEFEQNKRKALMDILLSGDAAAADEFDLFGCDPKDFSWLAKLIPGITVTSAGGACPFQAEGMIDELHWYYRDRGTTATLSVNPSTDGLYSNALYGASMQVEEFEYNWIENLLNLFEKVERRPGRWFFAAADHVTDDGRVLDGSQCGWGTSVEEAWEDVTTYRQFAPYDYISEERQRAAYEKAMRDLERPMRVVKADERVFPQADPFFVVNVPDSWRDEDGVIRVPSKEQD